jgi:hypothetical protein
MLRKAETFPPVTMGHIRGHDCRGLRKIATDRRIVSVDAALTEEEIGFLQELVDAGEVGCTIGPQVEGGTFAIGATEIRDGAIHEP